jgi:hypothetical protein
MLNMVVAVVLLLRIAVSLAVIMELRVDMVVTEIVDMVVTDMAFAEMVKYIDKLVMASLLFWVAQV